ncbi:hypothetical protein AB6A40_003381 [Gnathostoma spinigerum]|uniref:Uncharacterized protein n=1 Tax=Gnathostoma spinigerum TaxID=75299 RepID=A0ABD6EJD5_9BILA
MGLARWVGGEGDGGHEEREREGAVMRQTKSAQRCLRVHSTARCIHYKKGHATWRRAADCEQMFEEISYVWGGLVDRWGVRGVESGRQTGTDLDNTSGS